MPVAYTTCYHKIREMKKPVKLLQGGQGAGKNIAMAIILLERAEEENIFKDTITIMTDTYENLKDGAISDFEFVFKEWGLNFYDYYNKQEKTCYWFGTKIQFRYLADTKPQKGKGPRRGILYINEGNRNGWEAVKNYIARSSEVYVDFNPDFEFWAHTELEPKDDCEKIIVTYKDNEMCPESEVNYIEGRRHKTEWFRVYGLGLVGTYSERRIYDFKVVESIPETAIRIPKGMDFGKSPDPTVLMDCFIDGVSLYVSEVFIENNLLPEKIPGAERLAISDRMNQLCFAKARREFPKNNFPKDDELYFKIVEGEEYDEIEMSLISKVLAYKAEMIIGDSSGATELKDLNKHGFNVRGVKKGPNSVMLGMKRLSSYDIKVLKTSTTTIHALSNFLYDLDENGKILPEPPKAHEPDTIAAIRYVAMAKNVWEHLIPKQAA